LHPLLSGLDLALVSAAAAADAALVTAEEPHVLGSLEHVLEVMSEPARADVVSAQAGTATAAEMFAHAVAAEVFRAVLCAFAVHWMAVIGCRFIAVAR